MKQFTYEVDVSTYFMKPERRLEFPAFDVHISGDPAQMVDVVILPDGYADHEMGRFIKDCRDFARHLFSFEPYATNQNKFNIRGIWRLRQKAVATFLPIPYGAKPY